MRTIIYTLSHPLTGEVRYVGKTCRGLKKRLRGHIQRAKRGNEHRSCWIRSLLNQGEVPVIAELDSIEGDGCQAERDWIALFRQSGTRLVNATDGGEGTLGRSPTAAERAKNAAAHRGKRLTPEHRAKIAASLVGNQNSVGRTHSDETKEKMSATRQKMSAGTKAKISAKISAAFKGKKLTPEHRAKLSAAKRGKAFTTEHRANLSASHKGKPHPNKGKPSPLRGKSLSPETKAKISAAAIARWAARGGHNGF
jgi:hypothetical protein